MMSGHVVVTRRAGPNPKKGLQPFPSKFVILPLILHGMKFGRRAKKQEKIDTATATKAVARLSIVSLQTVVVREVGMRENSYTLMILASVAALTLTFSTSCLGAQIGSEPVKYGPESALIFEVKASATLVSVPRVKVSCGGVFAGTKTTNENGLAIFTIGKRSRSGELDGSVSCRIYKRGYDPVIKTVSLDRGRRYQIEKIDLYRRQRSR